MKAKNIRLPIRPEVVGVLSNAEQDALNVGAREIVERLLMALREDRRAMEGDSFAAERAQMFRRQAARLCLVDGRAGQVVTCAEMTALRNLAERNLTTA